jgi:mannosyltransferase
MLAEQQSPTPVRPRPNPHDLTIVLAKTHAGTVVLPQVPRKVPPPAAPSPVEDQAPVRRITVWTRSALFAVPATATFALGWKGIGQRQMWNDEYATQRAATLSWGELSHLLDHLDRVLTLYYVLMHFWVSLAGDSPTALRLPSVIAMAAAAGFTALVGQRLLDGYAGLIGGLIFALLPVTTRYAQEARPYAFAVAAAALSTLLLLRALDRPVWRLWLSYALCVGLTAGFHLIAVLVVAPHAVLTWFCYQKRDRDVRLWKSIGALALVLAIAMPLAYAGSGQAAAIEWIKADQAAIIQLPEQLFGSYPTAAALAVMGFLAVLVLPFARRRRVAAALLVWAILPPVFTYVTFPVLHAFLYRYLLFTLPAWALLAAGGIYGIDRLLSRHSWAQVLIAMAALPTLIMLTLPGQLMVRERLVPNEPDYPAAVKTIRAGLKPGDGIAFAGAVRPPRMGMAYEMRGEAARPVDVFLTQTAAQVGGYGARECPRAQACVGNRPRIWLVSTSYSSDPWSEMPAERADTLSRLFKVAESHHFQRLHVYLLVRKAAT